MCLMIEIGISFMFFKKNNGFVFIIVLVYELDYGFKIMMLVFLKEVLFGVIMVSICYKCFRIFIDIICYLFCF